MRLMLYCIGLKPIELAAGYGFRLKAKRAIVLPTRHPGASLIIDNGHYTP
jgi:hypothetical protein